MSTNTLTLGEAWDLLDACDGLRDYQDLADHWIGHHDTNSVEGSEMDDIVDLLTEYIRACALCDDSRSNGSLEMSVNTGLTAP